jgi:hypothetical protein
VGRGPWAVGRGAGGASRAAPILGSGRGLQQRTTTSPASKTRYLYVGTGDNPRMETDGNGNITKFYVDGVMGPFESFDGPPPVSLSSPRTFLFYDIHGNFRRDRRPHRHPHRRLHPRALR